ncbi:MULTISPECIES: LapD/MoxY N-terminal periplasmic domain-containing protein [Campylobacter]|uniref:bifunctional diguanylate cyclase/phosphodiesterase n=1 Tax=Campylobacter TaxID=194 RepID=UPI0014703284|nr:MULTISPECIES: LapD/MoxY N-terminal periplasmic domain-containing protein [Campylobacter]MBN7288799.1 EAL domain-containing protein [Campylobacter curvus]MDU6826873.1 LapD/MoxY N-terminal periplasmic domain-containing protein [Campylobacter sp.]
MTLFKQIMLAVIAFGIVIFMAVGYLNFKSLNSYINDQLGENARHTANSLGLALKPIIDPDDMSMAETMINSMFDSGRYQLIKLEDVDGKILIESSQPTQAMGVPEWFFKFAKFEAPIAQSEIMTGWTKFGTLYVQGSTALAYNELYSNIKNIFEFLLAMIAVSLVVSYFGLKAIFKPLLKVQNQAEAILDNKFLIQDKIPFTTDLRQMVLAMNSMVKKVEDIFEREAATLNKYQELLYKDGMSGAYNRRFFQTKFSEYLASEEYSRGAIVLISFKELVNLKKILGFEKWQSFIIKIAQILKSYVDESKFNAVIARLNDNDFALLMPSVDPQSVTGLTEKIMDEMKKTYQHFAINENEYPANAAIVDYEPKSQIGNLLTTADVTLANARLEGNFTYKIFKNSTNALIMGKEKYRDLISKSMQNDMFKFASQKVASSDDKFEQYELYLRLVDDEGKWQMASYFMPMVNELDLGAALDLHILNRIAQILPSKILPDGSLAINLGKEILNSDENFYKLEAVLKKISASSKFKNYIEIPNKDDISLQSVIKLTNKLKEFGFGFGFDHFGLDAKSIERLKELNPDYVKIQAANIIDFFSENGSAQTRQSLEVIMNSKDIKLVAIGVENEEQKKKLLELGIMNMQGIYIDEIKNIG